MTRHETEVRRYYEVNTPLFKRWENLDGPLALHREIWGPGVDNRLAALDWIHRAIAEQFATHDQAIDLGCGNGAALLYLARQNPDHKRLIGITLSPYQAAQASLHLSNHAEIRIGSYLDSTMWRRPPGRSLFYAIESFAHTESVPKFFSAISENARPGDSFILVDDLLAHPPNSHYETRLLKAFSAGWKVPDLQTEESLIRSFNRLRWQLAQTSDWSHWIKPPGFWQKLGCKMALSLTSQVPLMANLKGGAALVLGQQCGLFQYRYMVWIKD